MLWRPRKWHIKSNMVIKYPTIILKFSASCLSIWYLSVLLFVYSIKEKSESCGYRFHSDNQQEVTVMRATRLHSYYTRTILRTRSCVCLFPRVCVWWGGELYSVEMSVDSGSPHTHISQFCTKMRVAVDRPVHKRKCELSFHCVWFKWNRWREGLQQM